MSDAHEQLEHAEHMQHAAGENKKIAMLIAVLALFLSFSETLGKSAQTEGMDANVKSADTWRKTAARYESDPSTGEGLKELRAHAKEQEEDRDLSLAKYHNYELASAAFQVGIVLASATLITGIVQLAWFSGALGLIGLVMLVLGLFAPNVL